MVNWKVAALMVALLVAAGVYTVQSRPRPAAPRPAPALVPCDASRAVAIRISGGGDVFEATRAAGGAAAQPAGLGEWAISRPRPGPADSPAVDVVAASIDALRPTTSLPATAAGQDLGLDSPLLTISCSLRGGASYTLSVGSQSFDGSGNYARASGDAKVYVIPAAEVSRFQKSLAKPPYRPSPTPSG